MAQALIQVPFLILGALSVKPLLDSLIPGTPPERVTNVRIGAGSSNEQDGNVPGIHLFDFQGLSIGWAESDHKKIDKGVGHDIEVRHIDLKNNAAAQAEYIAISQGGNDAICISYVTVTTPDGIKLAWNGDIGYQCGAAWTYGNTTLSQDANGGIYQPRCIWIDGDGTNGFKQGMGIHLPSFLANQARVDQYNNNNDVMCKADPRFHMYDQLGYLDMISAFTKPMFDASTLVGFNADDTLNKDNWVTQPPPETDQGGIFRRSDDSTNAQGDETIHEPQAPKQGERHRYELIKSPSPNHSARELCESRTSYSPDFVSLAEGLFCNMETRKIWPVCKTGDEQSDCFDVTTNAMQWAQKKIRVMRRGGSGEKVYKIVHEW